MWNPAQIRPTARSMRRRVMASRRLVHRGLLRRHKHTVAQHDLRRLRHRVRGGNLRVGVVGAVQLRLALGAETELGAWSRNTRLSASGVFMLTMKSGVLASLASSVTATLITEAVASITIPGTGVGCPSAVPTACRHRPSRRRPERVPCRPAPACSGRECWPESCGFSRPACRRA